MSLGMCVLLWWALAIGGGILLFRIRRRQVNWNFKLVLILLLFLLIFGARVTVNVYAEFDLERDAIAGLENGWERGLDGAVHALQSFSMDEDYTEYTRKGKDLFENTYGVTAGRWYVFVISLLNITAPIIGGAILLEILTGIFPRARLFFWFGRRKVVFSELNEASVTLAEDLYEKKKYRDVFCWVKDYQKKWHLRPLLVFTDAYPDRESENRSELFERVRALRAVCIKTDLLHLNLRRSHSVHYMLMDEQDERNIITLAELIKGAKITCQSGAEKETEKANLPNWPIGKEVVENAAMEAERREENEKARKRWKNEKWRKADAFGELWEARKGRWRSEELSEEERETWRTIYGMEKTKKKEWDKEENKKREQWGIVLRELIAEAGLGSGEGTRSGGLPEDADRKPAEKKGANPAKESQTDRWRRWLRELDDDMENPPEIPMPNPPKCEEKKAPEDPRTRVYIFCQDEQSLDMINDICAKSPRQEDMLVRPIRDYFNMAVSLMYEVPLFSPLLPGKTCSMSPKSDPEMEKGIKPVSACDDSGSDDLVGGITPTRELHVTILGGGRIAEDVFRAVFWCGQMSGIQLYIHILAENGPAFARRIAVNCPEIPDSCREGNRILRLYSRGVHSHLVNSPYAIIDGWDQAVDAEDIRGWPKGILDRTDYYVVTLGEDKKNIRVSSMLSRELSRRALTGYNGRRYGRAAIVAPVVFEPHMADAVKRIPKGDEASKMPCVIPFGMLTERFSCRNVFLSTFTEGALRSDSLYNTVAHKKRKKDEYTYWANVIRAVHAPYKLFALGLLTDVRPEEEEKRFVIAESESCERDGAAGGKEDVLIIDDRRFRWMEHRRWNAYMRTQGFRGATAEEHAAYFRESRGEVHKDLRRKLHNCLVECSLRGNNLPVNDTGSPVFEEMDALDLVSYRTIQTNCEKNWDIFDEIQWKEIHWKRAEYKQYDGISGDEQVNKILEYCGWVKKEKSREKVAAETGNPWDRVYVRKEKSSKKTKVRRCVKRRDG